MQYDTDIKKINTCTIPDIYYFGNETFNKTKNLYEVYYDNYNFNMLKLIKDNDIHCPYAKQYADNFNKIICEDFHKYNSNFSTSLRNLKHLFEKER